MNTKNITKTIIQSLFLIVLFISPFAIDKINLLSAETNVTLLFPYKIAFENPVFVWVKKNASWKDAFFVLVYSAAVSLTTANLPL